MCYRIFIAFAVMCLLTGSVRSQQCKHAGLLKRYQLGRCPKCHPDSPELPASQWYGSSRYWRKFSSPVSNGHLKNSIFSEGSSPYADSALKQRESRKERDFSTPYFTGYGARHYGYFNPYQISQNSIIRTSPMPQTLSQYGFSPEQYLSMRGTGLANNNDHSRFPRHYGNFHQNQIQPQTSNFGKSAPYPQRAYQYENNEKIMDENRQINIASNGPTAIDTPWNKKVFVVYRADADPSTDDLDQDKKYVKIPRSVHNIDNNSVIRAMKSMNDVQLEDMLKRAIEISTEQNTSNRSHQRRQINNNDNESASGNLLDNWMSLRNVIGRGLDFASARRPMNQGYLSSLFNLAHIPFSGDNSQEIYNNDYEDMYDTWGTEENPHKAEIYEMGTLVLPKFTYDYDSLEEGTKERFSKKREISPQERVMVEQSKQSKLSVPINYLTSSRLNELNEDGFANREGYYEKEEATKSPEAKKAIEYSGKNGDGASTLQADPDFVGDMAEPPTTVTESTLERHFDDLAGTPSTLST